MTTTMVPFALDVDLHSFESLAERLADVNLEEVEELLPLHSGQEEPTILEKLNYIFSSDIDK